jgi:FkbM family methyltransferase
MKRMASYLRLPTVIRTLPLYVRRFGLLLGARIWSETVLAKVAPCGRTIAIRVPGIRTPLLLRSRTSDVKVFHQVFVEREHDVPLPRVPGFIIDAGANVGFSSVFFANRFPDARIVAVEPEPSNFRALSENVAQYPNIRPLNAALWPRSIMVRIVDPSAELWAIRVDPAASQEHDRVQGYTVTDLMREAGVETVDLLKLDIEGSERELFADGPEAWLSRVEVIMVELHESLASDCRLVLDRAVLPFGFRQFRHGEFDVLVRGRAVGNSAPHDV